jgi:hypothetical protein
MFSACDKSRPGSPTRSAYRTIRGGRIVRGVLRSQDFKNGKVAESSTIPTRCVLPKQIGSSRARPGRPSAAGRGVAQGGPYLRRRRRIPAALAVGPAVHDLTGYARGRHQCRPSFLFPRLGESFRRLRGT